MLVVLSESIDPEELQAHIGMEADRTARRGDPARRTSASRNPFHLWEIGSQCDRELSATDHLADLRPRLLAMAERVPGLGDHERIVSVSLWIHLDSPGSGFSIDLETLQALVRLRAQVEVDVYS